MKTRVSWLVGVLLAIGGFNQTPAQAAVFTLPVLDPAQVNPIFEALASTIVFRSLEPPSHPTLLGFWFNVRANGTVVSTNLFASQSAVFPFANLQFGVNIPHGFGLEFGLLPTQTISGTSFGSFGAGLKWNFIRTFSKPLPIDAALRFGYTTASVKYQQTLLDSPISVDYAAKVLGFTLDISKNLTFIEPYIGVGILRQSSTLSGQGSVSLFNNNFPVNTNTVDSSSTSTWLRAGIEFRLFATLGFQYDRAYGANTYSGKFGFKF